MTREPDEATKAAISALEGCESSVLPAEIMRHIADLVPRTCGRWEIASEVRVRGEAAAALVRSFPRREADVYHDEQFINYDFSYIESSDTVIVSSHVFAY
jgi:hypothetical protein